ncbi:MAG TPA: pyridoxamine 5'-phosphate oxidase family protein [Flavisolibacter sp.]
MDSINQQQAEKNHEDLQGKMARKKLQELAEKATSCFFCTGVIGKQPFVTRPMTVQKVDEEGSLWFLSANDSHKNKEIAENPVVQLLFQGSSYADFLHITGMATISEDKQKIKELWNPFLKVWFTEGENDPRISIIKVDPVEGYYWDTKHNKIIVTIKRIVGAITGKTLDDSIEGSLDV